MAQEKQKRGVVGQFTGCLLAPFNFIFKQFRFLIVIVLIVAVSCAMCAWLLPATFESIMNTIRNASLSVYTYVVSITGNPTLKVIVYEVEAVMQGTVDRTVPFPLSMLYDQRAEVRGAVRVALGADLRTQQVGVLACEINPNSIEVRIGGSIFAGSADPEGMRRIAMQVLRDSAGQRAIERYWDVARQELQKQIPVSLGLVSLPEQPQLTQCPNTIGLPEGAPTPTPFKQ
ncbi:MAG: hypothetical protein OHK0023_00630 [Anaerolineae bacterium]